VAKRLIGSGCRLDGVWGRSRDGYIRWDGDRRSGKGCFKGEFGASHCNQSYQWGRGDALFPNYFGEDLFNSLTNDIHSHHPKNLMTDRTPLPRQRKDVTANAQVIS